MEETSPGPATGTPIRFEHTGRAGEMAPMVIGIGLLNIVTLSFYRFWGKTRVRRYLWGHTSLLGDPLEYTGTGMELFKGFLIVLFAVLLPLVAVSTVAELMWGADPGLAYGVYNLAFVALVLFLIGVAQYRARRYRLGRTLWRGIRGAQSGSATKYGLATLGFYVLLPITLGWIYPAQNFYLTRRLMNGTWFGDRRFSFEGGAGPLYKRFAAAWLIMIGVFVIVGGLVALIDWAETVESMDDIGREGLDAATGLVPFIAFLSLPIVFAWYRVGEMRYMATCARYEGLRFTFEATTGRLIRLIIGNLLIVFLTLGFGLPIVQLRMFRFFCDHLRASGEVDFEAIRQSTEARLQTGEGLADAFDVDAF